MRPLLFMTYSRSCTSAARKLLDEVQASSNKIKKPRAIYHLHYVCVCVCGGAIIHGVRVSSGEGGRCCSDTLAHASERRRLTTRPRRLAQRRNALQMASAQLLRRREGGTGCCLGLWLYTGGTLDSVCTTAEEELSASDRLHRWKGSQEQRWESNKVLKQ